MGEETQCGHRDQRQSALERMRGGRVVDLADVRRYLDSQRGW